MKNYMMIGMIAFAIAGCKPSAGEETGDLGIVASEALDEQGIINGLKSAGLPIEDVTIFTAENDPNELLGRPNQYIGKAEFYDADRQQGDRDIQRPQIYLERFADAEAAKARHDYIEAVTKNTPFLVQYQILNGNILLRLDKQFTPAKAKAYEAALSTILP